MSKTAVKTALVGVGRWGKNVARELDSQSELVAFASHSDEHDLWAKDALPKASRHSIEEIATRSDIHAVAIATPIDTHASIARRMLEAGKYVLCEKPLATTSEEADTLVHLAKEKGVGLVTGYVFLYHPAYRELKKHLASERVKNIQMTWEKYGTFGESIEFNLLTHHLALALDLAGMPERIDATQGIGKESACDILDTTLHYADKSIQSSIHRLSETKNHIITVECDGGVTYVWDDKRLNKRIDTGEENIPLAEKAPLSIEIENFLRYAEGGGTPLTAGPFGAEVLRMHEKIAYSSSTAR